MPGKDKTGPNGDGPKTGRNGQMSNGRGQGNRGRGNGQENNNGTGRGRRN